MFDLTQRQIQILKNLIEEYIETAEPVGSETLEKKHNLAASPATIRNEMVTLEKKGYLKKPHTSAGRIPTGMAMKFYVKQLMKAQELSVAEEVRLKERVWDYREREQQCLHMLVKSLAEKTKALAIATTSEGDMFAAGYANILDMPEFFDIDITKSLLTALDEYDIFQNVFASAQGEEDIYILLDDDLGPQLKGPYGFVFTKYQTPLHSSGEIGVLGPTRLNYNSVIPVVKYFGGLVEEIAKGW
jgi:heat-inducible transcriptional repressor